MEGNRIRGIGRFLPYKARGEGKRTFPDNEGVSPNESKPDSASLRENGGGQPSRDDEACHQWGSNERKHLLGRPGWLGRARAERSVEGPGRPGVVVAAVNNASGESITTGATTAGSRSGP